MFLLNLPTENLFYLVLYLATLLLHVIAMNYVLAGAVVIVGVALFDWLSSPCEATRSIEHVLKDWLPLALGVTITLGVAPILFVQLLYKRSFYTANLLLFHRWMSILPVLIVAFYLLYLQKSEWLTRRSAWLRLTIALGIFAAFAFVAWSWTENHLLSLAGQEVWSAHYAASRMFYFSSELVPRLAVWITGAFPTLAILLAWQLRSGASPATIRRLAWIGGGGALASAVAASVYYARLPADFHAAMRNPALLTLVAVACLAGAVELYVWVKASLTGSLPIRWLVAATVAWAGAMIAATLLREVRRQVGLVAVDQWQIAVDGMTAAARWSGLPVFLLFLLLNTVAIGWVIWLVRANLARREA